MWLDSFEWCRVNVKPVYLAHLRQPNTIAGGACGLNIRVMSIIEVEALLYLAHLSRPNTIAGGACGSILMNGVELTSSWCTWPT